MNRKVSPTKLELRQLNDGTLRAFIRPMDEPEGVVHFEAITGLGFWMAYNKYNSPIVENDGMPIRTDAPFQPGDVITWQEEWQEEWEPTGDGWGPDSYHAYIRYRDGNVVNHAHDNEALARKIARMIKDFRDDEICQPASTMPVEFSRYKSTVAKCWPVKANKLEWVDLSRLGLEAVEHESFAIFRKRFCLMWPDIPLVSWAWWIELQHTIGDKL